MGCFGNGASLLRLWQLLAIWDVVSSTELGAVTPETEKHLAKAVGRVEAAVRSFASLRASFSSADPSSLKSLRQSLTSEQVSVLEGRAPASRTLLAQFQELQSRGRSLRCTPVANANVSPEVSDRQQALHEQPDVVEPQGGQNEAEQQPDREEEHREGQQPDQQEEVEADETEEVFEEDEDGGAGDEESSLFSLGTTVRTAGDTTTLCGAGREAALRGLVGALEGFAADLEGHLRPICKLVSPHLPPAMRRRLVSEGLSCSLDVDALATAGTVAPSAGRFSVSSGSGAIQQAVANQGSQKLAPVVASLSELNAVARLLQDRNPLLTARRLGQRLSRLSDASPEDEIEALRQDVDVALQGAMKAKELEQAGNVASSTGMLHPGGSTSAAAGSAGVASSTAADISAGSAGCDIAGVHSWSARFDEAAKGFRGAILQVMLPPEVENLHRVVHSVEALKNALLHDFSRGNTVDASGIPLESHCQRYFSSVAQFEADLTRYKGMVQEEQQQQSGEVGKRPKPQAKRPARTIPGAAAGMERLELPTAVPGGSSGTDGPALNAKSFR